MRQFLTVVMVAALVYLGWKFSHYARREINTNPVQQDAARAPAAGKLQGMPASLEESYQAAKREGAQGVSRWLAQHQEEIRDPRLTDIELDYVLLVGRSNVGEARRVLAEIRQRIKPTSPVYRRFEQLSKAYE